MREGYPGHRYMRRWHRIMKAERKECARQSPETVDERGERELTGKGAMRIECLSLYDSRHELTTRFMKVPSSKPVK